MGSKTQSLDALAASEIRFHSSQRRPSRISFSIYSIALTRVYVP
jgi:hypothetical protein